MTKYLSALLTLVLAVACDDPTSDGRSKADSDSKTNSPREDASADDAESNGEVDANGGRTPDRPTSDAALQPSGTRAGDDARVAMNARDAGLSSSGERDGGAAHTSAPDGAVMPPNLDGADGGVATGAGSCCTARDSGGCGNADLMVCVCEKDPSCCTKAWGRQCVFIVEQKYCQTGVRDCVCGSGEGQWGQSQCCESEWSSTCDSVAKLKCDALPGCF